MAPSGSAPAAPTPGNPPGRIVQGRLRNGFTKQDVYADAHGVTYGNDSMRWADVEWFGYSLTREFFEHRLYGLIKAHTSEVGSSFTFVVGRGAYRKARGVPKGPDIPFLFFNDDHREVDEMWRGLVDLAQQHLQPRLLGQMLDAIRAGQQVTVANEYTVDARGLSYPRLKRAYAWSDIEVSVHGGSVWLQPVGRPKREGLEMVAGFPNATLIPHLYAELTTRR